VKINFDTIVDIESGVNIVRLKSRPTPDILRWDTVRGFTELTPPTVFVALKRGDWFQFVPYINSVQCNTKSASPWASNVVVMTKHDGTPRITLDYRALNNVTYKDSYPLPIIVDCLDAFWGLSRFGILDLRFSIYQVPLAGANRDKTAFITRCCQWRFCALRMGLSNSPATFKKLMDLVLRGLTWESVLVYIDDIVVYAHTYSDLKLRLEEVFIRRRGA